MPWSVSSEEKDHFVVAGNAGAFRIAKGNLSPNALDGMRKMCRGGKVKLADGGVAEPGAKKPQKPPPANASPNVFDAKKKIDAHNAALQQALNQEGMADGGEVAPQVEYEPSTGAPITLMTDEQRAELVRSAPLGMLRGTGFDEPAATEAAPAPAPQQEPTYTGAMARPGEEPAPQQAPAPTPQHGDQSLAEPSSGMPGAAGVMGAARATEKAIAERGKVEQTAAADMAAKQEAQAQEHRAFAAHMESRYAANRASLTKMFNDLQDPKNDIKPDHFWESKSGFEKMRAGLGMIVTGIGAGLQGTTHNLAVEFIQRGIDRDIDAQKANLGKKQGALAFYSRQMQDDLAAEQMTKATMLNALASELAAQGSRNTSAMAQQNTKLAAAELHQNAIDKANQAVAQETQSKLHKIQLQQAVRNEYLLGNIYNGNGAADQNIIKEAGGRGLIKPVVIDRKGTLGIARSDGSATKLNDELPALHTAQDILERMQQLRNKEGPYKLFGITDASDEYNKLRSELAVNVEKGLAGRVSDQTIHNQIANVGSNWNEFVHSKDPLGAVRQTLDAQHRALVNQHTWQREGGSVVGAEAAPTPRSGAGVRVPPVTGAVHVTNGQTGAWLPPGKALPAGWRRD
jgi:hypothetical protein